MDMPSKTINSIVGLTEAAWNEDNIIDAILGAGADPAELRKGLKALKKSQLKKVYAAIRPQEAQAIPDSAENDDEPPTHAEPDADNMGGPSDNDADNE